MSERQPERGRSTALIERAAHPVVSVIVPTRNSAATIAQCLTSVRAQTYSPIEIIVVDNASDDDTVRLARAQADQLILAGPERSAQTNRGVEAAHVEAPRCIHDHGHAMQVMAFRMGNERLSGHR